MIWPYRLLAEALAEVQEGVDFYLTEADFDPTPAMRFEAALSAAISEIRESPTRWPFADDERDVRRFPLVRPFQDWAVFYLLEPAAASSRMSWTSSIVGADLRGADFTAIVAPAEKEKGPALIASAPHRAAKKLGFWRVATPALRPSVEPT